MFGTMFVWTKVPRRAVRYTYVFMVSMAYDGKRRTCYTL